ncbi:TPA: RpiB/LacA/LacB family sugar-phosphate isomerase [Candidatus Woesearchaeota archaeon]|nr:RpiB/LacA/LacB family sugar-phosphate isomerase [Candidatus Woesearchaeota archaeon]
MAKSGSDRPTLILGSDHGGFRLKKAVKKHFYDKEFFIEDFSPRLVEGDDYPDEARSVSEAVAKKKGSFGLLFCKTGTGMVMAANKMKGVRAAFAHDDNTVKMARKDEDANVLCFPGTMDPKTAIKYVDTFIRTKFTDETRHKRRIRKLEKLR